MQNVNSYMICMAFYIYYYYGVGTTLPPNYSMHTKDVRSTIKRLYILYILRNTAKHSSDTARGHYG